MAWTLTLTNPKTRRARQRGQFIPRRPVGPLVLDLRARHKSPDLSGCGIAGEASGLVPRS
jgi:hypothetical protein